MDQVRLLQSTMQARDVKRERARNRRTGLALVAVIATLLIGSIVYVVLFPTVK